MSLGMNGSGFRSWCFNGGPSYSGNEGGEEKLGNGLPSDCCIWENEMKNWQIQNKIPWAMAGKKISQMAKGICEITSFNESMTNEIHNLEELPIDLLPQLQSAGA
jgi:hypothetical protein